ncbi:caspase domain-containing protein [Xylaria scruposa]|nr:caspase domain-containing protein [Xylaria scruposa]
MTESCRIVKHHALLIGINFYPQNRSDEWRPPRGCVQDVRDVKESLVNSLEAIDVRILTASINESDTSRPAEHGEDLPTHSNVISNLEAMTSKASRNDFIYIHFSGHGTAIKPDSGFSNSSTGDLALVVIAGDDETKIQYLRGSELAFQLKKMVQKELKVTLVLDCCASGSVVRDQTDPSVRYVPYDLAIDMAYPPLLGRSLSPEDDAMRQANRDASMHLNWLVNPNGYTILTACGPTERAYEMNVGGQSHGALSYFLTRTFAKYGRVGGKQQHIYSHLCARFKESWPQQNPMLYGNKSIGFFDNINFTVDVARIPIIRKGATIQLGAGQAHGVCDGDRFVLHPVGSAKLGFGSNQDPLLVQVTRAGALTSDLKLLYSGLTATALTRLSLRKFPVCLEIRLTNRSAWDMALLGRQSFDIQFADSVKPGTLFSFYVVVVTKDRYEIRNELNQEILGLPASPHDLGQDADYVLDIVEHLAKFKMVECLVNSSPSTSFSESFSIRLVKASGKEFQPGCLQSGPFHAGCTHSECLVEVEDGDIVRLAVENKEEAVQTEKGEADRSIRCHLYSMGSRWEIESLLDADYVVIPPRLSNKSDDFLPGTSGKWEKMIAMTLPQGQDQCDDILKVFLTRQSTSFMSLELPKLCESIERRGISKGGEQDSAGWPEDWVTLNFRIRTHAKKVLST